MSTTQRIAAGVEYCGVNYCGWQYQKNAASVQLQMECAIAKVADETVRVTAAGRTDTGVHGICQVIHFDTHSKRSPHEWIRGVNRYLPDDITLRWVKPVVDDFHARFSALERSYRYVILNRDVSPSYLHGRVTWHQAELLVKPMQEAALALLGRHNFSAFRAASCQSKDPHKEIRELLIKRDDKWIWIDIRADGFLHHMVRNIAGTLLRIGEGREDVDWARLVLAGRDRIHAGVTAPPDGLYFVGVQYDRRFNLPVPPKPCRFW